MIVLFYFSIISFFLLCLLLAFLILIQESKSLGLGASFGGDVSASLFGTSTPTVLKKLTGWLAVMFFASCLILSYWSESVSHKNLKPSKLIENMEQIEK
jgi:preprotein translocase subunit SecG